MLPRRPIAAASRIRSSGEARGPRREAAAAEAAAAAAATAAAPFPVAGAGGGFP